MCFLLSELFKNNKYSKYFVTNSNMLTRLSQIVTTNSHVVTTNSNVINSANSDGNSISDVNAKMKVRLKPKERQVFMQYKEFTRFRDYFTYYKTAVKIFPEKKPDTRLKDELNGKIRKFLTEKSKSDLRLMRGIISEQIKKRFKKKSKKKIFLLH